MPWLEDTLGFHFCAAGSRLQIQELQLCVGKFFAARSVLVDTDQTQSFFQNPDLILCELELVLINRERSVELLEQCNIERLLYPSR